jgi:hypothetical protein
LQTGGYFNIFSKKSQHQIFTVAASGGTSLKKYLAGLYKIRKIKINKICTEKINGFV